MSAAVALVLLAGCASQSGRAPVEDRAGTAVVGAGEPARSPPGAENAGKPGYYSVRKGDTLIRIGLETGQNWRDIARWNNLDNPNSIEVDQVLRVVQPARPTVVAVSPPGGVTSSSGVVTRPVSPSGITPVPVPPAGTNGSSSSVTSSASTTSEPATTSSAPISSASDDEPKFIWPTNGTLLAGFDEQRNKGLDIGGQAGSSVVAAADGRVVYAGAGLRGYGNLIILKHNNTYLTAYAHNQALLVKEDQSVKKGQKIAEMGSSDADRVKLHFEVRRQGKPVDPSKFLPPRQ
ncbi:MAG: peptidoglycan DD-metalloendopeptidase family protein [Burkholderiales bacterium]